MIGKNHINALNKATKQLGQKGMRALVQCGGARVIIRIRAFKSGAGGGERTARDKIPCRPEGDRSTTLVSPSLYLSLSLPLPLPLPLPLGCPEAGKASERASERGSARLRDRVLGFHLGLILLHLFSPFPPPSPSRAPEAEPELEALLFLSLGSVSLSLFQDSRGVSLSLSRLSLSSVRE